MSHAPDPIARRRSWRNLRPAAWLALTFAVVDCSVRLAAPVWERHSPDDYAARVAGCAARPRGFVVIGGSPVSEGFDPAVIAGVSWAGGPLADGYAVGLPGGTLTDFAVALNHAAPSPPRLVVYGAAPTDINDARSEPHGVDSLYTFADLPAVTARRPDAAWWVTRNYLEAKLRRVSALYQYRHGVKTAAARAANRAFPSAFPEAAREAAELRDYATALREGSGYAPNPIYALKNYERRKQVNDAFAPFGFLDKYRTGSHWRSLAVLRDWCADRGTDFVVVEMPVTEDLETRYPSEVKEFRDRLDRLPGDGYTLLRADRAAVGLTDADFGDITHLNRGGAARLSAWLRAALAALPVRP